MKKSILGLVVASLILTSATSVLASGFKLDWQSQLKPSKCNPVGDAVIDISEKVKNDVDSGTAGNYWAFDNYEREIKVWHTTTPGTFCATVKYEGGFKGIAGQKSPGGTAILTGKEQGELKGGRRATIIGTLLPNPTWAVKGSVGTVNYACSVGGNCPGYVNWTKQYFNPGYSYSDDWWGWIYKGEHSGTWINSISGNFGDIIWKSNDKKDKDKDKDNED